MSDFEASPNWRLREHRNTKPRVASFPEQTLSSPPPHVRLLTSGASGLFRSGSRFGASGHEIFVAQGTFPEDQLGEPVRFEQASATAYHWHNLRVDGGYQLKFAGAVLALAGIYLEASTGLGEIITVFEFSSAARATFYLVGVILMVAGLVVELIAWAREK